MPMRSIKPLSQQRISTLALILLPALCFVSVVAQQRVSQRSSGPSGVQSQSVRYGGTMLPSEQRYVQMRSGLLPSEYRDVQWSSGALPSQGRIAGPPSASASLRYPAYSGVYNRTANSMAPAYNSYSRKAPGGSSSTSIRYGGSSVRSGYYSDSPYRISGRVNTRVTGSYSFHQNYNSYTQVTAKPKSLQYRTPSLRYNGQK